MKTPRFSDLDKHAGKTYASAEQMKRPGYLKAKFARIRAKQKEAEEERRVKVQTLPRKVSHG